MSATLAAALEAAQRLAIDRLVRIMTTSTSDREVRLAAQAILKLKPPVSNPGAITHGAAESDDGRATTVPQRPARPTAAPVDAPLTSEELTRLRRLLPHIRPERFTRKRSPSHWRQILATHGTPTPLRQAG